MPGAYGISLPTSVTVPSLAETGATVHGPADRKLRETAREFEATLLTMLLKNMRESLEPDGLFPGDSGDVQGGLFDLYLGRHLADAGGIGVAAALVRQIQGSPSSTPTHAPPDVTPVPAADRALPRMLAG